MTPYKNSPSTESSDPFDDWDVAYPVATALVPATIGGPTLEARVSIPFPHANKPDHFPAFMSRSGLFGVASNMASGNGSKAKRSIKAQSPYAIEIDGPAFAMSDKRAYEAVVRIAKSRRHDLNETMDTSLREIALEMGIQSHGGSSLASISVSLARLSQTTITFRLLDKSEHSGRLLATVETNPNGVRIGFDPDFVLPAFELDRQFQSKPSRRHQIDGSLAQWLHDFFQTHSVTHDLTLGYLRGLCGYASRDRSFASRLELAMKCLSQQCPELIESFGFTKLSRHSNLWSMTVKRGPESPNFFNGSPQAPSAPIAAQKAASKAARRRGVAL